MPKPNATPSFDPAAMFASFKMPAPFKLPNVDVDAFVAVQRRNVEAVTAATTVAADGYKALAARQTEMVHGVFDAYVSTMREMMGVKDPSDGAAKQVAFATSAFEKSITQTRELADIATKANTEAFDVLNKRVVESLDEIKSIAK